MSTKVDEEPNRHSGCLVGSVVVVIVCLTGLAMLIPAVNAAREAANRASCVGNYKLSASGCSITKVPNVIFPRRTWWMQTGNRGSVWRVLILPYLEKKSLYEQFHFDEQWNSPHNIALGPLAPCGMDPRRCASITASAKAAITWKSAKWLSPARGPCSTAPHRFA